MHFLNLYTSPAYNTRTRAQRNFLQTAQRAIFALAVCCTAPSIGAQSGAVPSGSHSAASLPNLGDGSEISARAERRQGDLIAHDIYRDPDYVDDAVIMDYVQSIWQPLLTSARLRGEVPPELDENYAWEVLLVRARSVNAFALPGGYLGLHLGLVGVVNSRDELAAVLAHELSHVTQRHIARLTERKGAQNPWLIGAMILGMLAASKSPDAGNAVITGGAAASLQNTINFSRDMEREADRIGFGVMSQAGFASQGFVNMFAQLQQAARLNDSASFPYLRVHPLTTERMADMQSRLGAPDAKATTASTGDAWLHALVSARARVLSNRSIDALRTWGEQANMPTQFKRLTPTQQAGVLYGATLAAVQLREYASAQALWTRLKNVLPNNASTSSYWGTLLAAELYLAQGEGARALTVLTSNTSMLRHNRAELLLMAQAQLLSEQATQAGESLQAWVAEHPRDAQAWQLLARAHAAQGQTLQAVRSEAESNVAQLNYDAALTRLKAAQEMVRKGTVQSNHVESSILQARVRAVELLLREQTIKQ